jgi:hypothetical protein
MNGYTIMIQNEPINPTFIFDTDLKTKTKTTLYISREKLITYLMHYGSHYFIFILYVP